MLLSLGIRDFVLIERLDFEIGSGLSVLTGETGAGKSILLDSLSLALGGRAEGGVVRKGATQAVITAEFDVPADHAARHLARSRDIDVEGTLVLRRIVTNEGRSRASINGSAVSVGVLREIGAALAEIQGQFEGHGLLDAGTHRGLLDEFGQTGSLRLLVASAYAAWRRAASERAAAIASAAEAAAEEDYLRQSLEELNGFDAKPGEELTLASQRAMLQQRDRVVEALTAAAAELEGERGAESQLARALRVLSRLGPEAGAELEPAVAALDRAAAEIADGMAALTRLTSSDSFAEGRLEAIEERLFALRALARKHQVLPDALAELHQKMSEQLASIEDGGDRLARLAEAEAAARAAYIDRAAALTAARVKAAARLDRAVMQELGPLKLEKARFRSSVQTLAESDWSAEGVERVAFEIATNPGVEPGPLDRIASGGELSRFMLALKLVLVGSNPVPTLVFDEVDSGIGGAVAAAVGERLAMLAQRLQVLVVTHSPQVAALGAHHWLVAKRQAKGLTVSSVELLDDAARREEIARMLSGATITEEARAAADSLLAGRLVA